MRKLLKKGLSIVLAVLMVMTAWVFVAPEKAEAANRISASGYNIVIGVPETVYMTPQNNYTSTTTSVKYYVNDVVSSSGAVSLAQENSQTAGKFYIYSPQISSVTSVSIDGATLSNFSATQSGSLFSDTSYTMTLSSGISSSNTKTLEWSIVCKMTDGSSATFYAYTVAYAPYLSPIFAATKAENTRGDNSFGSGITWISGITGISSGASYYPYNNFLPLCGGPSLGGGETSPNSWFNSSQQCNLPAKGGYYSTKEYGYNYGDETLAVYERSAVGYINVDNSRYSNLNQIPNLVCGIYLTDAEGADDEYIYVGKLTSPDSDKITSGTNWYTRSNTTPSEWNDGCTIYGGDKTTDRGKNCILRDVRINDSVANGYIYIRGALKTYSDGDNCFGFMDNYLNVVTVNKSTWRTAVQNAQKYGFQSGWYSSSTDYNNWKTYLKSVAEALGNPNTTSCSNVTNLNNATTTLRTNYSGDNAAKVNDLGVVKVLSSTGTFSNQYKVVALSGVTNPLETASFYVGDTVKLSSTTYSNYTYSCNVLMANQKTAGTTVTNASLPTGLGSAGTGTTVTLTNITQAQATAKQQQRTFYYLGNDKTVTINPNGGSWNGSTSNSTITGSYSGTFAPVNPTRTGYTFDGWTLSGGGSLSGTTYTFGADAGTLTAKWTAITYSVAYNGNGSTSGSTASSTHTYDTAKALTTNGFKREFTVTYNANGGSCSTSSATASATFNGWATTSGGSVAYTNGQSVKNLSGTSGATVTLYAKWTDGSVTLPTATKAYDSTYHYTFNGWYDASSGGNLIGAANAKYTPSAAKTLYAQYTSVAHSYTSSVVTPATCTTKGTTKYTCSCGYSYTAQDIAVTSHSYTKQDTSATYLKSEATCTESAVYYYACSVCGEKGTTTYTYGSPLGHNYSSVVTDPTCTEQGYTTYTCSRCDNTYKDDYTDALGHSPAEAVKENYVAPTYDTDESYDSVVYCSRCNEELSRDTVTISKLERYIELPDTNLIADFSVASSYTIKPTTAEGITYSFIGIVDQPSDRNQVLDTAPTAADTSTGKYGTLKIANDGTAQYTVSTVDFSGNDTYWLVVSVKGATGYSETVYTYQKLEIVPATSVYYEDSFAESTDKGFTYTNSENASGNYGVWKTVGSGSASSVLADLNSNGYTSAYDSYSTYSGNSAHMVSVSSANKGSWPKMNFSFTGTGFDLISVTSGDSGIFTVTISQNGTILKKKIVDTYYGYTYSRLYLDGTAICDSETNTTGAETKTLYMADTTKAYVDESTLAEGCYSDNNNHIFTTDTTLAKQNNGTAELAYGWVVDSTKSATYYQIPVISITDLDYGKYDVTIEARFTKSYGHYLTDGDTNYFNLYVDGIRVYNPAKGNTVCEEAYDAAGVNNVTYTKLRDCITSDSVLVIDGKQEIEGSTELSELLTISPNNEVYLKSGSTITFDADTTNLADLLVGMKSVNGTGCSVTVSYGSSSKTIQVNSATEMYYSLLKQLDVSSLDGTVTITNNGSGILSLTSLKATSSEQSGESVSNNASNPVSVSKATAANAIALLSMTEADLSIDEDDVETTSTDGTVTMTIKTSTDVSTLIIKDENGNTVTPEDISVEEVDGVESWTVVLAENESGTYTYYIQGQYENGYTGDNEATAVTVTVDVPDATEEATVETKTSSLSNTVIGKLFSKLIELIRFIIGLFE